MLSQTRRSVYCGWSGGTRKRPDSSALSRSASPVAWAIQVPSHARNTGSSAVTKPLGGTDHESFGLLPRDANDISIAAPPNVSDAYLLDGDNRTFLAEHNPSDLREMTERLLDAMQRGMCREPGTYRDALEGLLLDVEEGAS